MYLTAPRLLNLPNVRHGFFTRNGGLSTGIFSSLNCGGRGSAEPVEIVDANRTRVADALKLEPLRLVSTCQVHGTQVVTVDAPWSPDARPKADAMVSSTPGIGLGILTADCVPVLFADAQAGVVGAAHSGWKGAIAGVLEATVAAMEKLGAERSRIAAAVGPAIAQPSYQVDAVFRGQFIRHAAGNAQYFTTLDADGHCNFDLPGYVNQRLTNCGVNQIEGLGTILTRKKPISSVSAAQCIAENTITDAKSR